MKVVLLETIKSLGLKGDIKSVSDGYAMNFLIPQKKALVASEKNINNIKATKEKKEKFVKEKNQEYSKLVKTLNKQSIVFKGKVSEKDHLFQGIHTKDIIDYVKKNFNLDLNEKWFKDSVSLKSLGKHSIKLILPDNNTIIVFVEVKAK